MNTTSRLEFIVPEGVHARLDKVIAQLLPEDSPISRSRIQALVAEGQVRVNGKAIAAVKTKVAAGDVIVLEVPPAKAMELAGEDIPLDILFEDEDLLVVNKPAGMVVHPAPGAETGTLVHAILYHTDGKLMGIGGVERPGIVHRIDKDTSGVLVVAKNDVAHHALSEKFARHDIERQYVALVYGDFDSHDPRMMNLKGVGLRDGLVRVDRPLARHPHDRKRQAVVEGGRHAVTYAKREARYLEGALSLLRLQLETGRTHQIRVHMTYCGHPLVGDPVYGRARNRLPKSTKSALADMVSNFPRQALHAETLGFSHPRTGETLRFDAPIPEDMSRLLARLQLPE